MAKSNTYDNQKIQQILAEAKVDGDKAIRARYKLANSTLAMWRRKYQPGSQVQVVSKAAKANPETERLRQENELLRTKLAEKLLEEYLQR